MCKTLDCQPTDLTDNKLMLAFAESFARQEDEPPRKTMAHEMHPEHPMTLERENAFLREKIKQKDVEILNLELKLNAALNKKGPQK